MSTFSKPPVSSYKDKIIGILDNGVKTLFTPAIAHRPNPAEKILEDELGIAQKQQSARLMRVNHCGEVCAQALYQGQALFARDDEVAKQLSQSAIEEIDHLAWTASRIHQLGGRQSLLNPLWYGGSFLIGAGTALISDKVSLGFVAETEKQVSKHLNTHLDRLPTADKKSRAIVSQMEVDEQHHCHQAMIMGASELPPIVKNTMSVLGQVMTRLSYWL